MRAVREHREAGLAQVDALVPIGRRECTGRVGLHDEGHPVPATATRYLTSVTELGSDGRPRVHVTRTSPIFGRRSLPSSRIDQRSERVNRAVCRLSLRLLNFGGAPFGPLRLPVLESSCAFHAASRSRRVCCITPTGRPERNARSSAFFAVVISVLPSSAFFGID